MNLAKPKSLDYDQGMEKAELSENRATCPSCKESFQDPAERLAIHIFLKCTSCSAIDDTNKRANADAAVG